MCWFFIGTWQRIVSAGSEGVWTGQESTAFLLLPHTQVQHQDHQASKMHDQTYNKKQNKTKQHTEKISIAKKWKLIG